jgi:hypothetical protein
MLVREKTIPNNRETGLSHAYLHPRSRWAVATGAQWIVRKGRGHDERHRWTDFGAIASPLSLWCAHRRRMTVPKDDTTIIMVLYA